MTNSESAVVVSGQKAPVFTLTGDENKRPDMAIGVIPIDSIFSPVTRVKYSVENTRVGQRTDYDKLILEISQDETQIKLAQDPKDFDEF